MAMVSMSNLLNGKDSRWLQLEVCREFQRNKCSRPDTECKFAHPPANVEVQNGRVTACYDSIKGRCNREKPPCKYFHPPQHLKDQLLINGRNHLALKNALMQQMGMAPPTPAPTILPSPLQPMTANRFMPASNPYNPYFGPGLLPIQIGPEHAATALASNPLPQAMSIATNAGTQPQKRTDRVQMDQMKFMGPYYEQFTYPGLMPYKRPAPDNKGYSVYQPSAAAYQQLMQLQSQQPYVPVSSQQNSISQSSPSKVVPSTLIEHNALSKNAVVTNAVAAAASSPDDGDSENALTVQNAKVVGGAVGGCDEALSASSTSPLSAVADNSLGGTDENNKAINDANGSDVSPHILADDAGTQTSSSAGHSAIDEHNLNANSFNSATSSSPAAALAAIYTTSSITNNNNSILSRKSSLTTPNQHLINSSKAPTSYTNTLSGKDSMTDYLSASSLNNHPQAALLSAMLYQQPYQQLALTQNHLYSDPAQMAKEMAQKNYANALKYAAAAQQSQASVAGKSQLTGMSYSGMTLSANSGAMYAQQPGTSTARMPSPMSQSRAPYMQAAMQRPMQNPFQQFIRPQMQMNMQAAATNQYYAAAAAHQQFMSQNMLYSGLTGPMTSQQLTATSGASTPTPYASSSYPYALSQAQAMNAQGLPASMMQVPQMTSSQPSQTGSAAVLNPYKKMKTS